MKLNSHQQQLLQLLNIKPLSLNSDFSAFNSQITPPHDAVDAKLLKPAAGATEHDVHGASEMLTLLPAVDNNISSETDNQDKVQYQQAADIAEFGMLFTDIQLLLSQLKPEINWYIQPQATCCSCDGDILITPELMLLQQAAFKRQLWQLLNHRFHNV